MSADRRRAELPPLVSAMYGLVISTVTATVGLCAHGTVAGVSALSPGHVVTALLACLGVGLASGACVSRQDTRRTDTRRTGPRPPRRTSGARASIVAALGLFGGQALVHLLLACGHPGGHTGHLHLTGGASGADRARALDASMDAASSSHLLSAPMAAAHAVAVLVTVALLAALAAGLSWLAARLAPATRRVLGTRPPRTLRRPATTPPVRTAVRLTAGGTRAPPVLV